MSRTSKTLLRLGVPSLAAATLVAGVPAFLGAAQAAPIGSLAITAVDANPSAAAGSCQAFYIDATAAAAGASTVGERVNVILSTATGGSETADATFCVLPTTVGSSTVTPANGTLVGTQQGATGNTTAATRTDQATFTLGTGATGFESRGRIVVGVTRNEPGTVSLQAYADVNANNTFDVAAGESQTTSAATFTAGGPAGSNANQNAVNSITVSGSGTDTVQNEARTYTVTALNAAGDPVAGAVVNYVITTGSTTSSPAVLGSTDNDGDASGTISLPNVGTGSLITFYVNQSDQGAGLGTPEGSEPQASLTPTVRQAPGARTIVLSALADTDTATVATAAYQESPAINPVNDGARPFRAVVDNGAGSTGSTTGTDIRFTVTGGSGDETVTPVTGLTVDNTATVANTTDSLLDVVVFDPTPVSGQVLTVTGTVRGSTTSSTATLTFTAALADVRNIDIVPTTANSPVGTARAFTATVLDFRGQPVTGVPVTFTETGPGAFRNGESTVVVTTNRSGQATAEVIAAPGESGTQTITASVTGSGNRTTDAIGTPFGSTRAGNRTATATNTVGAAVSPSPSATTTVSPSPSATNTPPAAVRCPSALGVSLNRAFTTPGTPVTVTVTGAPAGADVQLQAYSRPSTTFVQARRATVAANGALSFDVLPGTNTRLFATCFGQATSASPSTVINVRTALSLTVVRNGTRNYTFQGTILPRRAGQLITLYRVTSNGTRVLTAQVTTDASGTYRINRRFTGSGTFGFLTRTGQTLTNAAGESNTPRTVEGVNAGRGVARPTAIF